MAGFMTSYPGGGAFQQIFNQAGQQGFGLPNLQGGQAADQLAQGYSQTPWAAGGAGEAGAQGAFAQLLEAARQGRNTQATTGGQIQRGNLANQGATVGDYATSISDALKNKFGGLQNQFGPIENQISGIQNQFGNVQNQQGQLSNNIGATQNILGAVGQDINTANINTQGNINQAGLFGQLLNLGLGTTNDLLGGTTPGTANMFSQLLKNGVPAVGGLLAGLL
jgi:hypothetical protein